MHLAWLKCHTPRGLYRIAVEYGVDANGKRTENACAKFYPIDDENREGRLVVAGVTIAEAEEACRADADGREVAA